jgi:chaperone modulatory protein CbpM
MTNELHTFLTGDILEERIDLTLAELCCACQVPADWVLVMIEEGVLEPHGHDPSCWRFHGSSVRRLHRAMRLQRDLGVNVAGVALALDLLDELEVMRLRLSRFIDRT